MRPTQAISAESNKYHVPALEKGLDILEALAHASQPLALTDLARRLDRSPSELFRLLAALEVRGYVNKDASTGTYSLSLKLYELAHRHLPERNLLDAAAVPMEEFARRTQESCHLSVVQFGKMIILKEVLTPASLRLSVAPGIHYPALHTSSGRLFLAYQKLDALSALLAANDDYQAMDGTQKQTLLDRLDHIRQTGLSSAVNENHLGVQDAAVPVGNTTIGLIAALASTWLTALSNPVQMDDMVQALRDCAAQITVAMGLSSDLADGVTTF